MTDTTRLDDAADGSVTGSAAAHEWFFPRGSLTASGWQSVVDDAIPGWQHAGLHLAEITDGQAYELTTTGVERLVVPLSGTFQVHHGKAGAEKDLIPLEGRPSVFAGPTDVLYVPADRTIAVTGHGRVAIASARTDVIKPVQYIPAAATPVELRGAGACSRQIHNFGTPQALDAARIIVCEVITPAGNFSSYPPHKHDVAAPGHESRLEEIYYFETAPADVEHAAMDAAGAMFATYSSAAGAIAINALVRTGDIALVPYGYHGPAAALPGYNLYYLNVMAGPDPERVWLISDDPDYAHVRESWTDQVIDRRLPLTTERHQT